MKITRMLLIAALVAMAGCDNEGVVRPPPTDVRVFHAATSFDTIAFLRESRVETTLSFGGGTRLRFDSGEYDFHFEYLSPNTGLERPVSFAEDLSPDLNYTFVEVSPGGMLDVLVVATPSTPASDTTGRMTIIHAHPTYAAFDAYFAAPGTPLAGELPAGSASYGPTPIVTELQPATYRLYLTPVGDPNTVLFESRDLDVGIGTDNVLVVSDPGPRNSADLIVDIVSNAAVRVNEFGRDAEVRMLHDIDDAMPRDLLLDDNTTTPLFSAQPAGVLSAFAPVSPDTHALNLTPVGTPGTIEREVELLSLSGRYYMALFAGNSVDGIQGIVFAEDARAITEQATVRFANVAGMFDALDIYLLEPGTDINTASPTLGFTEFPRVTARLAFRSDTYEMTIQDPETSAVVYGPATVTLANGGVYGFALLNGAGGGTVDVQSFYDTP